MGSESTTTLGEVFIDGLTRRRRPGRPAAAAFADRGPCTIRKGAHLRIPRKFSGSAHVAIATVPGRPVSCGLASRMVRTSGRQGLARQTNSSTRTMPRIVKSRVFQR
ncbi:hypothetical protein QJS66_14195 [Kocuria rhizophila]|nr:hypothetical protein QJS66_14195 [Kocuria rhizophila]